MRSFLAFLSRLAPFPSKFAKNFMSCAFSQRKQAKSMWNSCSNLGFVRIFAQRLEIMCLRHRGLDLKLFCGSVFCPHTFRNLEFRFHVTLRLEWDAAIDCTPMPFCRVDKCLLLGWSYAVMGCVLKIQTIVLWSFSQNRNRTGCATIGNVFLSVP